MSTRKPRRGQESSKPAAPHRGGPEARAAALALLAEGYQLTSVARQLGVSRMAVREWRDSPEGRTYLDEARQARQAALRAAHEPALRLLQDSALAAAQVLVDKLRSKVPFEADISARAILDRIGLPKVERVEAAITGGADLSKLTDEELAAYEALQRKARGE